jgi:hypothetical protein
MEPFLTIPAIISLFTILPTTQVQATPSYFKNFVSPQNSPGNTTNSRKTIELVLVTDYVYYQQFKTLHELKEPDCPESCVKGHIKAEVKSIYEKLKGNYEQLQTSVVLLKLFIQTKKDPWQDELTAKTNNLNECCWDLEKDSCENHDRSKGSTCDVPAENILEVFNTWRKQQTKINKHIGSPEARAWQQHDLAHLISGYKFNGSTIGLAYLKSVCGGEHQSGITTMQTWPRIAATMTHELGHNMGLSHYDDNDECKGGCVTEESLSIGCIMKSSTGSTPSTQWSQCSVSNYGSLAEVPCIYTEPDPDVFWDVDDCGDGIISGEEECDCGRKTGAVDGEYCNPECCNPLTCKLKNNAVCDTVAGGCCDETCQLRPLAYQCRPSDNECDMVEVCTGLHPRCPANVFKREFEQCNSNQGFCSSGFCQTGNNQCSQVFGPGAYYDKSCFDEINTEDGFNNHCSDLKCKGTFSEKINSTKIETGSNGCFWMKKTPDTLPPKIKPGTPCGSGFNGFCSDGNCVNFDEHEDYAFQENPCPGSKNKDGEFFECNNHGICNSQGNCHCECGYAPPYCIYKGEGGSVDSATVCPSDFTMIIVVTLILLLIVVPLLLYLVILWYLRKYNFINKDQGCFKGFLDAIGIINNKPKGTDYKVTEVKTPAETPENRTRSNTTEIGRNAGAQEVNLEDNWANHPGNGQEYGQNNGQNVENNYAQNYDQNYDHNYAQNYTQNQGWDSEPNPSYGATQSTNAPPPPAKDYYYNRAAPPAPPKRDY